MSVLTKIGGVAAKIPGAAARGTIGAGVGAAKMYGNAALEGLGFGSNVLSQKSLPGQKGKPITSASDDPLADILSETQRIDNALQQNNQLLSQILDVQKSNKNFGVNSGSGKSATNELASDIAGGVIGSALTSVITKAIFSPVGLGLIGTAVIAGLFRKKHDDAMAELNKLSPEDRKKHDDAIAEEKAKYGDGLEYMSNKFGEKVDKFVSPKDLKQIRKERDARSKKRNEDWAGPSPTIEERRALAGSWGNDTYRELEGTLKNPAKKLAAGMSPVAFNEGGKGNSKSIKIIADEIVFKADTITFDVGGQKSFGGSKSSGFQRTSFGGNEPYFPKMNSSKNNGMSGVNLGTLLPGTSFGSSPASMGALGSTGNIEPGVSGASGGSNSFSGGGYQGAGGSNSSNGGGSNTPTFGPSVGSFTKGGGPNVDINKFNPMPSSSGDGSSSAAASGNRFNPSASIIGQGGQPGINVNNGGGAEYLAKMREPLVKQAQDPATKRLMGGILSAENAGAGPAVIEGLYNRTAYVNSMRAKEGKQPLTLKDMILGHPDIDHGKSFYGPVRSGAINSHMDKYDKDPAHAAKMNSYIDQAQTSNLIKGHTDQGSAGDPNFANGGQGINLNKERFNDWMYKGRNNATAFREKMQADYAAAESANPYDPSKNAFAGSAPNNKSKITDASVVKVEPESGSIPGKMFSPDATKIKPDQTAGDGRSSPLTGTFSGGPHSHYGADRGGRAHSGVDWQSPNGSEVRSMTGGTVLYNGHNQGYGANIVIKGDDGVIHRYATHAATANLKVGTRVDKGTPIGTIGEGHLHYESIDPNSTQGKEMIANPGKFVSTSNQHGTTDPASTLGISKGTSVKLGEAVGPQPETITKTDAKPKGPSQLSGGTAGDVFGKSDKPQVASNGDTKIPSQSPLQPALTDKEKAETQRIVDALKSKPDATKTDETRQNYEKVNADLEAKRLEDKKNFNIPNASTSPDAPIENSSRTQDMPAPDLKQGDDPSAIRGDNLRPIDKTSTMPTPSESNANEVKGDTGGNNSGGSAAPAQGSADKPEMKSVESGSSDPAKMNDTAATPTDI